ncbi:hypothetical protein [Ferriphaselus sp. R-1]|uniref:hypothetical protein n=1 Tax=Ferriphaselus sp. R-1 TaxID=1485544 RepID=UPI000558521E|nr:hypothetical protein [Ferriphaselus sp. R-1]
MKKAWLGMAAVLVAGCGSFRVGEELATNDRDYPQLNSAPRQVRLEGKLSADLELKMRALYETDNKEGCQYSPTRIAGGMEGALYGLQLRVPLEVVRHGDSYSATFMPDRFQPGRCNWRPVRVEAYAYWPGKSDPEEELMWRRYRHLPVEVKPSRSEESWAENSADTPAHINCRRRSGESLGYDVPCLAQRESHEKETHILKPTDQRVVVNFTEQQ